MNAIHKIVMSLALFCAVSAAFAEGERTISISASETPGAVKLVFGEAPSQDTLYLHAAYGATDGGDTPGDWENFVYVADVTADMTEYDCALPSGWGTSVTHVRYFLTTEHVDYSIAYEYIKFNGNNGKGSYFNTGYAPIPSKTHIVADFKPTANQNMAIFCSRGSGGSPTFTQLYLSAGPTLSFDCGPQNSTTYRSSFSASSGTRYLVESGPNLTVCPKDGSPTTVEHPKLPEGTNFTTTAELYLFATHSNGSPSGNYACGEARFVRIYESDTGVYDKSTLVHEYVPVLNPNTKEGALYDTVAHQFIKSSYYGTKGLECTFENPSVYKYVTAGSTETFDFVPRTLEVVSVAQEGGTTKATLAVSAGNLVREAILLAFGDYDYGAELSAWPTNEILSVVSPDAQQVKVAMPSCWNTAAYSSARFFLVHCSPITLQVMESVKGDGSAYIDLGRKGVLGDMVQITARACGKGALFGARESATENCFSVKSDTAGASRDLYLDYSDYSISRGNYSSRPDTQDWITFLNSPTERCVYSGTDTSGAAVSHGTHWNDYPHYGDMVRKDFTTPVNLRLFDAYQVDTPTTVNRFDESVKSFYLWHIDGTTTNLVMDLIPVRKETTKEAGFYDLVSRKLFTNAAGTGAFTAEGSVQESFITPTVFRPESVAQMVTKPIFASSVSASIVNGTVKIKVVAPEDQTWYASVAYGMTDMGPDPVAWGTNVVAIADGSGTGSGEVVCALPVGWRKTMKAIRVFLSSAAPMMTYEYLKGDGRAYLDLGRKGIFGDMVEFKCKYNSGVGGSVFGARLPNTEGAEKNNFSFQGLVLDYSDYNASRAQIGNINVSEWLKLIVSPTLRQAWQGTTSRGKNEEVVTKTFETDNNLWLFNVGGFNGSPLNGCIKDFELRHAEGAVMNDVMRLVPVRVEDNIYGMFDEVRGRILLNAASSGAFSVEGAAETGLRAYPAYKCTGVSDPVNRGGLLLFVK